MARMFLGIDPGKHGGLVLLNSQTNAISTFTMPDTEHGVWRLIGSIWAPYGKDNIRAMIEKVQGHIGFNQPGAAMFKFGMGYGGLRMALVGQGISFSEVAPVVWQRRLGVPPRSKGEKPSLHKKKLCVIARQLFPRYVNRITLDTCDAVLLAEYARRLDEGDIETPEPIVITTPSKGKR